MPPNNQNGSNNPYGPYNPAPPPQPHEYEFITNSGQTPKQPMNLLPSGASTPVRIAVVVGGLIVLIILFAIVKGLLSGGGNTEALTSVAQEQQQIIHITSSVTDNQSTLSTVNQNFAVTAQAALTSGQTQLLAYMKQTGHSLKTKQLNLKVSNNLDQELTTASTNSTYDTTFHDIMQDQLKSYETALQVAYKQTAGPKGKKLLKQQYDSSQLLLQQLNAPAS